MAKKSKKPDTPDLEAGTDAAQGLSSPETGETQPGQTADPQLALKNAIVAAQAEASRNWDLYLRERADLENARKRHQRDREEATRYANDRLLKEMIPVLDNLERAVEHAEQSKHDNQGLLDGVNMTINQFRKTLEGFGVKAISAIGSVFDPNLHQAIGQVESAEQAPNTVATELQKGYLLHDRLLRPSLVMVAKAPAGQVNDTATD